MELYVHIFWRILIIYYIICCQVPKNFMGLKKKKGLVHILEHDNIVILPVFLKISSYKLDPT